MIEEYFDDPIKQINGYDFDLIELEDLQLWFETEQPEIEDMSARELAVYEQFKEDGII